jgi:hypothetical protein
MTETSRCCAGCGALEGSTQILKATKTRRAVTRTVDLQLVLVADWQRHLCPRCRVQAARLRDRRSRSARCSRPATGGECAHTQSAPPQPTDNTDKTPAEPWGGSAERPTPGTDRTIKSGIPKKRLMNQLNPQRRFNASYLAEFRPGPDTPAGPCQCGDTVFYRLAERSPWRCRTCEPLNAHLTVRWFVCSGPPHEQQTAAAANGEGSGHQIKGEREISTPAADVQIQGPVP